ncbi:MAG: 30S ribosomal protein S4 [Candidatus Spechtbacteria bacterium]|nr:30S ribosomal protein S4 [Candidatus Spechtbacteria bacterium]
MPKGGARRQKSEYGQQFAEKQKLRNGYGLRERQFHNYFKKAQKPDDVFNLLEMRLDSVVYRLGFAMTRPMARQMVGHKHITVNGKVLNTPSYQSKINDVVGIRLAHTQRGIFIDLDERLKKHQAPTWIRLDKEKKEGTVVGRAAVEEAGMEVNIHSVIEFYSR